MSDIPHIVSSGFGVQSSTMLLMAARGEITPMPVAGIFADTMAEPKSVYDWRDWLITQLPFPIYNVSKGSLSDRAVEMKVTKDGRRYFKTDIPFFTFSPSKNQIAKIRQRACTREFKVFPILKKIREIAGIKRGQKTIGAVSWIGISLDEIYRMKPSRDKWVDNRWPLVELRMNRADCLRWMERNGYPTPPRSACVFCPYHSNEEWRRLKTFEPLEFEKAVQFEKAVGKAKRESSNFDCIPFLHRSCKPLNEVDLSTEEERGQGNLFLNECEGMCGV